MEKEILSKEDFNLTREYELFDVIYTVGRNFDDNEIKVWTVIGHVLSSSSEKRAFEYQLCSHPISVYIVRNKKARLSDFRNHFISKDKKKLIEMKKESLKKQFEAYLSELK